MTIKINTRPAAENPDVTIFDIAGRLTLGEGSSALRDAIKDEVERRPGAKILLNLAEVRYIDASGIGELVSGFTTVANSGGALRLLNLTKRIKDRLQISKLYTVFDVHDNEGNGVRAFGPSRPQPAQQERPGSNLLYE
jgi:anti-sigma B factor antagonist